MAVRNTYKLYLAGPISGLTYEETVDWRETVKQEFKYSFDCYSPMRAKSYLADCNAIDVDNESYEEMLWTSPKGIFHRDISDLRLCDGAIVNLLGAKKVSIGTVCEIATLYEMRKQMVVIMEPKGNIHDHVFIREMCPFIVHTVEEAIHAISIIFEPVGH